MMKRLRDYYKSEKIFAGMNSAFLKYFLTSLKELLPRRQIPRKENYYWFTVLRMPGNICSFKEEHTAEHTWPWKRPKAD